MVERRRSRRVIKGWRMGLLCVLILLAAVVAVSAALWHANAYIVSVSLKGDPEMTLEYGTPFQDPGAAAEYAGTILHREKTPLEATALSNLDTSKVGTYTITYQAVFQDITETVTRTVHVVDTQPPQITLTTDPDSYTLPGAQYEEEGFAAYDGYDGDLTDKVVRTETDGEVIYTVFDSSGNKAEVRRTVVYKDPAPPVLTLKGDVQMVLNAGTSYSEPGYTASDNCGEDLTAAVTVEGAVDIWSPGTYTLTYTVTDGAGNTASATRTVTVKELQKPVQPNGKTIYLTFDDGPGEHTPEILEVLNKYGVKATFFVVNTYHASYIQQIAAQGHAIGAHTATHRFEQIYASEEAYFQDLEKIQAVIEKYAGYRTNLLRFPGGSANKSSSFNPGIMTRLTKLVQEKGYCYFDWNVDSRDALDAETADAVFNNVVAGVTAKTNAVVLMHDLQSQSVDAVEKIIIWGLANGYKFVPLSPDAPECHQRVNN